MCFEIKQYFKEALKLSFEKNMDDDLINENI